MNICNRCERNVDNIEFNFEQDKCLKCTKQLERQRANYKRWLEKNKEKEKERERKRLPEKRKYAKKYLEENRNFINEKRRLDRLNNPEKYQEYDKRKRNKTKYKEWKQEYDKKYYELNAEEIKLQHKQYYEENKEYLLAKQKIYNQNNKEKRRKRQKQYYKDNFDNIKVKAQIYRQSERGRILLNISKMKHKKRIRILPFRFTRNDWDYCFNYFEGLCPICNIKLNDIQLDHWIPVSNPNCPGTIPTNIILLCGKCNREKWNKKAEDWLIETYMDKAEEIINRVNTYFASLYLTSL